MPSAYAPTAGPVTVGVVQSSVAVAVSGITVADLFPVHSATSVAGQVICGGVLSVLTDSVCGASALPA